MLIRFLALCAALLTSACVSTVAPAPPREEVRWARSGGPVSLDRATWDRELFALDSTNARRWSALDVPVRVGAFPVPPYDSPGNGYGDVAVTVAGRTLSGHFASVNRNPETEPYFEGIGPDASGVVVTTVLVVGGTPGAAYATSRNHPVYLAQGRIGTAVSGVDWLSLAVPDQPDLVIINTRVFDLRAGRTVLVAPLADGTLRFHQVMTPVFEMGGFEAMSAFGDVLGPELDTEEVRAFVEGVGSHLLAPQ